jgi:flagellar biosynthesis/type III secretory pathway protein FliH
MQPKPLSGTAPAAAGAAPRVPAGCSVPERPGGSPSEQIEVFQYPSDPHAPYHSFPQAWRVDGADAGGESDGPGPADFEQRLAEETRRSFEAGRERGHQEERKALAGEQAAAREREKRQLAALVESFTQERNRYLQAVEQEVVRLALAVAARILRREAQMDPLLLTGAVRVALGQLAASTQVRLRVPVNDLALWTEAIALLPNLAVKPAVAGEEGMRLGECLIETELGSVDLGVRSQLGEIERGFFDRAGAAPSLLEGNARDTARDSGRATTGPAERGA